MFNQKLIKSLKQTIKITQQERDEAREEVAKKDYLIKMYQEEHEILLNNASELRAKNTALENNIEILRNNLSEQNKELVNASQTVD